MATTARRDAARFARFARFALLTQVARITPYARTALVASAAALLGACTTLDPYADEPARSLLTRHDAVGDCARLLQRIDAAVDAAGARDAEGQRIRGHPQWRSDRLTARLANDALRSAPARQLWLTRLRETARAARAAELSNIGPNRVDATDAAAAESCAQRLADDNEQQGTNTDTAEAVTFITTLTARAQVDDHYSTATRALGLYAITRIPFAAGVRRWQQLTLEDHAPSRWPPPGDVRRYALESDAQAPTSFDRDALGLPQLNGNALQALFNHHAPILDVQTQGDFDRIGAPVWAHDGITTRADDPVVYTRLTHTRFGGRWLPQLVYTFWFASRPPDGTFDVLAGRLDGIMWRVTLDDDLQPLFYDAIHPCGCYHLYYPTPRVRERDGATQGDHALDEALFVPQRVTSPQPGERAVLRIESRSHYLRGVVHTPMQARTQARMQARAEADANVAPAVVSYRLASEDHLRQLPWPTSPDMRAAWPATTRSLYGPDGMVASTERLERFLFWPMGIASAGQMRQWGHHATAFVGRRHFDDPGLADRYFERVTHPAAAPH